MSIFFSCFQYFSAVADILLSQPVARIVVGDPHQQIYAFRGAINAMDMAKATHTMRLSHVSFRESVFVSGVMLAV